MVACETCKDTKTMLYETPRPGGPPAYNDGPCPDCTTCPWCELTLRECECCRVCKGECRGH